MTYGRGCQVKGQSKGKSLPLELIEQGVEMQNECNLWQGEPIELVTLYSDWPKLTLDHREQLRLLLIEHQNVFAWSHKDMFVINLEIIEHRLCICPRAKKIWWWWRSFSREKYATKVEEVEHLLEVGFIHEVPYLDWVSNFVLVKNMKGKYQMCVYFTDLSKARPKNNFPLPWIDQIVDSMAGHCMLSFMDTYSGYN